jgi:hypothetical protein
VSPIRPLSHLSLPASLAQTWREQLEAGFAGGLPFARVGVSRPASCPGGAFPCLSEGLAKFAQVHKGHGRKPEIPQEKIDEIVRLTQESKPEGETH